MTRPLLPLALLFLLMPALPAVAQSTPARTAAPQAAVIAFADLCIMAPGPEAEDAAVRKRGGTPIKDTPPPGSAPGRHFDLQVDNVRARVCFGEWVCMLEIGAADADATAAVFDGFVAEVFTAMHATPTQPGPPPPGGRILRDLFLEKPGDPFRMRLTLAAIDHPGAPQSMVLLRRFEPMGTLDGAGQALTPAGSAPNADAGGRRSRSTWSIRGIGLLHGSKLSLTPLVTANCPDTLFRHDHARGSPIHRRWRVCPSASAGSVPSIRFPAAPWARRWDRSARIFPARHPWALASCTHLPAASG